MDSEEIQLTKDKNDWLKLTDNELFYRTCLAFFAGSDGIVIENLGERFRMKFNSEVRAFYSYPIIY